MRENGTDDDSGENSDDKVVVKLETFEASWGTVIHYVYADTTCRFFSGTALVSLDYGGTCFMCGPGCVGQGSFSWKPVGIIRCEL